MCASASVPRPPPAQVQHQGISRYATQEKQLSERQSTALCCKKPYPLPARQKLPEIPPGIDIATPELCLCRGYFLSQNIRRFVAETANHVSILLRCADYFFRRWCSITSSASRKTGRFCRSCLCGTRCDPGVHSTSATATSLTFVPVAPVQMSPPTACKAW